MLIQTLTYWLLSFSSETLPEIKLSHAKLKRNLKLSKTRQNYAFIRNYCFIILIVLIDVSPFF